jgi:RNA polymerase sigma factor (TIGR02999 family)
MDRAAHSEITGLLGDWAKGDGAAFERLAPLVLAELRRIASRQMQRERPGHTLQPTALVNEAFLRLAGGGAQAWQDRAHFYAVCAQIMRRILIDHARAHGRDKRGGGAVMIPLDEAATLIQAQAVDVIALGDALTALERLDPRKARIVDLRYFAGLGIDETADVLNISAMTVRREWTRAKAWLYRQLAAGGGHA